MTIEVRQNLDFRLTGDIPRYWFGGDPFRTRFFDAHSLLTPGGEKFFINSVRAFKDEIVDPQLRSEVKAFINQEGQHSLQHTLSNRRLELQGIDAADIESGHQNKMEGLRQRMPKRFALAFTTANEHVTAMFARAILEDSQLFAEADPRIFALYAWHCAEEFEHKAVSFDVMQQVAKIGYVMRVVAMMWATVMMQTLFAVTVNRLLRGDGLGRRQRILQWCRGLLWLYGRKGPLFPQLGYYFAYFKPGFHPGRQGLAPGYGRWLEAFKRDGDPISAAVAVRAVKD